MTRTLNLPTKRFSLAELGDDWKDCYIEYRPMTVGDLTRISQLSTDQLSETEGVAFMLQHAKSHSVGGRVSTLDESGKTSTSDLTPEDVDQLPVSILSDLFAEMSGGGLDPNASASEVAQDNEQPSETGPTETSSSTA